MSGHSDSTTCPNCESSCSRYSDHKPFSYEILSCINCGFTTSIKIEYMDLEELNFQRAECDIPLLKTLPKQTFKH